VIGKQGNQGDKQVASLDKSIEVRPQPEVEPPKLTSINSISECLCLFY